jgi:hypothetical protein
MTKPNRTALFWGFVLIAAGLLFLLYNFNMIPGRFRDWWPVLAIAAGLWLLVQAIARRGQGLVGGVVLSSLGTFWLLDNQGRVAGVEFLPVLLIALGVGLLLRGLVRRAA